EDPGWEKVRALADEASITCSLHGRAEAGAVFHRKMREGALTPSEYRHVLKQFALDCEENGFRWAPLSPAVVTRVEALYERLPKTVFLRASDALHLACASENGFREIYSNDNHLLAAAHHFALRGLDIIGEVS